MKSIQCLIICFFFFTLPHLTYAQHRYMGTWTNSTHERIVFKQRTWEQLQIISVWYTLIDYESYVLDGKRYYDVLFERGENPGELKKFDTWKKFIAFNNKHEKKDCHLVDLEIESWTRYSGLWKKGVTPKKIEVFNSWEQLESHNSELEEQGYKLVEIEVGPILSMRNRSFVGIWEEVQNEDLIKNGIEDSRLRNFDNTNSLEQAARNFEGDGLNLVDVGTYFDGDQRRYFGVWWRESAHFNDNMRGGRTLDELLATDIVLDNSNIHFNDIETYSCSGISLSDIISGCTSDCQDSRMIIGCDNRYEIIPTNLKSLFPWRSIGKLTRGCTGILVNRKFVLTAGHCLFKNTTDLIPDKIGFSLAEYFPNNKPYGTHFAKRVFLPAGATDIISNEEEDKALDYAIIELSEPILSSVSFPMEFITWDNLKNKIPYSLGYPGDMQNVVGTGPCNRFIEEEGISMVGGKGLLFITNDGVGGQSGSPVYVFDEERRHKLVGILVGSPKDHCELGQIWAARLTNTAIDRIQALINLDTSEDSIDHWKIFEVREVPSDIPSE